MWKKEPVSVDQSGGMVRSLQQGVEEGTCWCGTEWRNGEEPKAGFGGMNLFVLTRVEEW